MTQQILAIIIILYFFSRLLAQKRSRTISRTEFYFWLAFWTVSLGVIIFIHRLDDLVSWLGFSASGIDVLIYLSVAWLFYLIFRIRLRLEKIEKSITEIARHIALQRASYKADKTIPPKHENQHK